MKIEEEIIYLPDDEENITSPAVILPVMKVLILFSAGAFGVLEVPVEKVQLIDICPQQW